MASQSLSFFMSSGKSTITLFFIPPYRYELETVTTNSLSSDDVNCNINGLDIFISFYDRLKIHSLHSLFKSFTKLSLIVACTFSKPIEQKVILSIVFFL